MARRRKENPRNPDNRAVPAGDQPASSGDAAEAKRSYLAQVKQRGTLTLPVDLRRRYAIVEDTPVQITEEQEGFFVRPMRLVPGGAPPTADLEELLAGITPENRHEEIDFGPPAGAEVW